MAIKDKVTTAGGGRAYFMVRSKFVKGPDGYGKVISQEREEMIKKNGGKDPGEDKVVMHKKFGAHLSKKIDPWREGTRGENTAESNKHRARLSDKLKDKKWKTKEG